MALVKGVPLTTTKVSWLGAISEVDTPRQKTPILTLTASTNVS